MSLFRRLLAWRFRTGTGPAHSARQGVIDRQARLEGEVAGLRATIQEMLPGTGEAIQDVSERLDGLRGELGKVGREQFRTTTLLEGQSATLDELAESWREQAARYERQIADLRCALAGVHDEVRLALVKDLLPIADALQASVRAARVMPGESRSAPARRPSLVARLQAALVGAPVSAGEPDVAGFESWLEGLLLVERRLLALLEREAVRPIPAVGRPFDPNLHLAVAIEQEARVPDGTVIREELRGYMHGERVLRHAEVVVARSPGSSSADDDGREG